MRQLLLIMILACNSALGCTCVNSGSRLNDSIYKTSFSIFVGEIISIDNTSSENTFKIKVVVHESIKNSKKYDTIQIMTNSDEGLCGLRIRLGEKWYFYINKKDTNNFYWEDLCGRSINLSRKKYSLKKYGIEALYYRKKYRNDIKNYRIERRIIKKIQKVR